MNESLPLGSTSELASRDIDLEQGGFMRTMIRTLSDVLVDVVGSEGASGYVSLVGQAMASQMRGLYLEEFAQQALSKEQISAVLVDLKRRIGGDFYVIEESPERIVFGNRSCPFGERVLGQPVLCNMTSNVFGSIASSTAGYARVDLEETISEGHEGCRIVVWLKPPSQEPPSHAQEFFGD
jgi:predicted ArsR family transcriptional regulator